MKRIFLIAVVFFAVQTTFAQEKGLHLTFGGGLGKTGFAYNLEDGACKGGIGYGGTLGLQYFFNYHWGISLAGEFYQFNTQSSYNDRKFIFPNQTDDEGDIYNFYLHLQNWQENQKTRFVEIPLMAVYQYKFGKKEKAGFYLGLGVKCQIPVSSTFERFKGAIQTYAYYPEDNIWLGKEDESSLNYDHHAYGTNNFKTEEERSWNGNSGKNTLKTGFAAVAECGFLFSLSRRVDLSLGVVADYGITSISKQNDPLLSIKNGATQQDGNYVAENVLYKGVLNSDQTPKINTYSVRGKIGLRIKFGRVKEIPEEDAYNEEDEEEHPASPTSKRAPDTIFVYPVIVYPQPSDSLLKQYTPTDRVGERVTESIQGKIYEQTYKPEPLPQEIETELVESIYFDLDKYTLTPQAKAVLDRKAELMRKYPQAVITVIGHTCDKGNREYNDRLSYNRAEAARIYLIKSGISSARIVPVPMGMSNPTYTNSSEFNRELNRRVDFIIAK